MKYFTNSIKELFKFHSFLIFLITILFFLIFSGFTYYIELIFINYYNTIKIDRIDIIYRYFTLYNDSLRFVYYYHDHYVVSILKLRNILLISFILSVICNIIILFFNALSFNKVVEDYTNSANFLNQIANQVQTSVFLNTIFGNFTHRISQIIRKFVYNEGIKDTAAVYALIDDLKCIVEELNKYKDLTSSEIIELDNLIFHSIKIFNLSKEKKISVGIDNLSSYRLNFKRMNNINFIVILLTIFKSMDILRYNELYIRTIMIDEYTITLEFDFNPKLSRKSKDNLFYLIKRHKDNDYKYVSSLIKNVNGFLKVGSNKFRLKIPIIKIER